MAQYKVQHNYRSDQGGFTEGDKVDLEDAEAAWFNADSPGLLEPVKTARAATEPAPTTDAEPGSTEPDKPKRGRASR